MRIITCIFCTGITAAALANRSVPFDVTLHQETWMVHHSISGLDSSRFVIIPYSSAYKSIFGEGTATTCSNEELELLQQLVEKAMHRYNAHKNMLDLPLNPFDAYYFQLMPVSDSHGDKEVWVNALCSLKQAVDWRKQLVVTKDGGSCYFTIKVNLGSRRTYDMMVNEGS